ncbi:phage tail tape-measure protein [Maritimibacter sp. 55A14]|uniref:phage tail tape-measure protein n=1 Tax=Maritimibacter sp. 55A14 TaxID=2174844 RepID=UPI000D6047DE|nr:phage tail tape-measure protein [Maritimibacter sp. 55A14]PWE32782.1 phage tail tape-measure protein [Maritimibacter sp. 55A14]
MADKRITVRLSARGAKAVRSALKGAGEAGQKSFARLRSEMDRVGKRMQRFERRMVRVGAVAAAAFAAGAAALVRSSLQGIDAQAKLAQSLDTTVASMQVLTRAGELAGVSATEAAEGVTRLTRRISLAEQGTGPAVKALERLRLGAAELNNLPVDERLIKINEALAEFVPEAERAGVISQLFGDRAFAAFTRLDADVLRQARKELEDFGVLVSDVDADQIERTNDAISALGLITKGLGNQLAVALAPALEAVAKFMAEVSKEGGPLNNAMNVLKDNLSIVARVLAGLAVLISGRLIGIMLRFTFSIQGAATALTVLRGALLKSLLGAFVVFLGEAAFRFDRLVRAVGGFGEALAALKRVAGEVFGGIVTAAKAIPLDLKAIWQEISADFLGLLAEMAQAWSDFVRDTFENSFLTRSVESFDPISGDSGPVESPFADFFDGSGAADLAEKLRTASGKAAAAAAETQNRVAAAVTQGFGQASAALDELLGIVSRTDDATGALGESTKKVLEQMNELGSESGAGGKGAKGVDKLAKALEEAKRKAEAFDDQMGRTVGGIIRGANSINDVVNRLLDGLLNETFAGLSRSLGLGKILGGVIPGFATGGDFPGGLRIVGERGPELEATGPARIFSAAQTRELLARGGGREPNVTVNVIGAPEGSEVQERRGPNGDRVIDVAVGNAISRGRNTQRALSARQSAQQRVRR